MLLCLFGATYSILPIAMLFFLCRLFFLSFFMHYMTLLFTLSIIFFGLHSLFSLYRMYQCLFYLPLCVTRVPSRDLCCVFPYFILF